MKLPNPQYVSPELIFNKRWGKELQYIDWKRFEKLAERYKGGLFLDAGCFNSPLIIELKKRYPQSEFIGLDKSRSVLMELQRRHPEVRYVVGDVMALQFKDEHFDYIVCAELLEHLENPEGAVKELIRVLKKGGILAISVPDNEAENGRVSPDHIWSFTKEDIQKLLTPYGETEVLPYKDTVKHLIAYCRKK